MGGCLDGWWVDESLVSACSSDPPFELFISLTNLFPPNTLFWQSIFYSLSVSMGSTFLIFRFHIKVIP